MKAKLLKLIRKRFILKMNYRSYSKAHGYIYIVFDKKKIKEHKFTFHTTDEILDIKYRHNSPYIKFWKFIFSKIYVYPFHFFMSKYFIFMNKKNKIKREKLILQKRLMKKYNIHFDNQYDEDI